MGKNVILRNGGRNLQNFAYSKHMITLEMVVKLKIDNLL